MKGEINWGPGVAVECVEIGKNTNGERTLGHDLIWDYATSAGPYSLDGAQGVVAKDVTGSMYETYGSPQLPWFFTDVMTFFFREFHLGLRQSILQVGSGSPPFWNGLEKPGGGGGGGADADNLADVLLRAGIEGIRMSFLNSLKVKSLKRFMPKTYACTFLAFSAWLNSAFDTNCAWRFCQTAELRCFRLNF